MSNPSVPDNAFGALEERWEKAQDRLAAPTAVADPRIVKALVRTGTGFYEVQDNHQDRERAQLGGEEDAWARFHGVLHMTPDRFVVPVQLSDPDGRPRQEDTYWKMWAGYVIQQAWLNSFGSPTQGRTLEEDISSELTEGTATIEELTRNTAMGKSDTRLWARVNPLKFGVDQDEDRAVQDLERFKEAARDRLEKKVAEVLADTQLMDAIRKVVRVRMKVRVQLVLADAAQQLDALREQIETPREQERFMFFARQAILVLGYGPDELQVEFMNGMDTVYHGAKALYEPAQGGQVAKIKIPLSHHGTDDLLELEELTDLIAHEVGHHQVAEAMLSDEPVHGMTHNVFTAENKRRLEACRVVMFEDMQRMPMPVLLVPEDLLTDMPIKEELIVLDQPGVVENIQRAMTSGWVNKELARRELKRLEANAKTVIAAAASVSPAASQAAAPAAAQPPVAPAPAQAPNTGTGGLWEAIKKAW
jgi:hypothetical protein